MFTWAEEHGLLEPTPAFIHDYHQIYPQLKRLEAGYEDVRSECLELLQMKERLVPMSALGGAYTQAGIHVIEWKTFMFKSGSFIEPNCARAPQTAALLLARRFHEFVLISRRILVSQGTFRRGGVSVSTAD